MFIIKRDGNIVKEVKFEDKNTLYKEKYVQVLTFDNYNRALEVSKVLNADVYEISSEELKVIMGV